MLTHAALIQLAARFDLLTNLRKGDVIYEAGDEATCVYIVGE